MKYFRHNQKNLHFSFEDHNLNESTDGCYPSEHFFAEKFAFIRNNL